MTVLSLQCSDCGDDLSVSIAKSSTVVLAVAPCYNCIEKYKKHLRDIQKVLALNLEAADGKLQE